MSLLIARTLRNTEGKLAPIVLRILRLGFGGEDLVDGGREITRHDVRLQYLGVFDNTHHFDHGRVLS